MILQQKLSISDLFTGDIQLTSPSNIYFELQKIVEDPRRSMIDAANVIEKDAALSVRLLKIVNSAFYGFASKIASINRAISMIGTEELQVIVMSTVVMDKFSNLPGDLMSMHDFWARSLRCALIAKGINHHLNGTFSESVFLCGLLHNIGQLIFFRRIPELTREVFMRVQSLADPSDLDEIHIEQQVIGFDHYQTGAALTKLWRLPELITKSIELHAYPDNTEKFHDIASIVRLADCHSKMDSYFSDLIFESAGIPPDDMSNILDKAYDEFEEIFRAFYPNNY